jgi:hypothetical protein
MPGLRLDPRSTSLRVILLPFDSGVPPSPGSLSDSRLPLAGPASPPPKGHRRIRRHPAVLLRIRIDCSDWSPRRRRVCVCVCQCVCACVCVRARVSGCMCGCVAVPVRLWVLLLLCAHPMCVCAHPVSEARFRGRPLSTGVTRDPMQRGTVRREPVDREGGDYGIASLVAALTRRAP